MGYNYLIEKKTLWEKKKLLVTSNFFFSYNVFKSFLLLMRQNEYLWNKGFSLNILILHRLRNKFLQLTLISLDSASWELQQYLRRMCGPMKNLKDDTRSRNRTRDLKISRPPLYLTTTDTTHTLSFVTVVLLCRECKLIDLIVFNAVFNVILAISQRPLHLPLFTWNSFYHHSEQYSFKVTD